MVMLLLFQNLLTQAKFIVPARATRGKVLLISRCDRHPKNCPGTQARRKASASGDRRDHARSGAPADPGLQGTRRIWLGWCVETCYNALLQRRPQEEHVLKFWEVARGGSRFRRDFLILSGAGRVRCRSSNL